MKRAIIFVAALGLLVPSLALAAPSGKGKGSEHGVPSQMAPNMQGNPGKPAKQTKPWQPNKPSKPFKPGKPGWGKPRPPSGKQFWHRGTWFGRIRGPAFVYPHGQHYRRWHIGSRFPLAWLLAQYFYDNYAVFGLEAPPPGYRWVRYGPDLLLVNVRTGEVEDVVYGVFY
jgi:Ni/Co efflux regulator RcnB